MLLLTSNCKKDDDSDNQLSVSAPTVTTTVISEINYINGACDAVCGGNVTSTGGGTITSRGICYGTSQNPTTSTHIITDGSTGTGSFVCNLTALNLGTVYYIRAYATNSAGTGYGNQITFNTGSNLPALTTTAVTAITSSAAKSGGYITSDGGFPVFERGVCWNTSGTPIISDSKTSDSLGTGTYISNITGLTQNVTYYVRAYATNNNGTSYGNELQFITTSPMAPTVTTTAATSITTTTAISGGNVTSDGGVSVTNRGICWSTSPNPTTADNITTNGYGAGVFTSNITGLTPNTQYYARAYATNSIGTGYGNQITFSTTSPTLPTLTTVAITDIRGTAATSGGNITSDGGAAITARGLCWSTSPNPTITNTITLDGSGIGIYASSLANLSENTSYYVKAYATNSAGTAYGNQITINSGFTYGTLYQGGLVFYNNGNSGGLVCAETDQSTTAPWGCEGIYLSASGTTLGTGQSNTTSIINGCSTSGIAARICDELTIGSYSDWYLPSILELQIMCSNLKGNSLGGFPNVSYWSSTELGNTTANGYDFYWWGGNVLNKSTGYYVRAVRTF